MRELYRLSFFLRPYWVFVLLAPITMALEVSLDLLQPLFVRRIIDVGVARADSGAVLWTLFAMVSTIALAMCFGLACTWFASRAAHRAGADIRHAVFSKVQSLSFVDLDELQTGSLITRLTGDVNQIQEMITMMLRGLVRMPLLLLGSVFMAILLDVRLSLMFLLVLPILVVALIVITRQSFPLYRSVQARWDGLNTVLQENLAGVRLVKAFARANHEEARFALASEQLAESATAATRKSAQIAPIMMLTLNAGIAAALYFGGARVLDGRLSVGRLVAFISYLNQALNALILFSNLIVQLSRAQASARRVAGLLEIQPALTFEPAGDHLDAGARSSLDSPPGRIEFANVSFHHRGNEDRPTLDTISFVVEPGQTVAIFGGTGSGKTALVQLIPRFYDVSSGRVSIDGTDVRRLPESDLRKLVGIAPQESVLFSATIRENVALGASDASDETIVEACRRAQADEFVRAKPEGYETRVGQRGVDLSGGQKQRLAVARALLPDKPILILDDSTSAVDTRTEARMLDEIASRCIKQTRLIVAQRIGTALRADRILVLEDGKLVGDGSHRDLLHSCSVYRAIHESQMHSNRATHA